MNNLKLSWADSEKLKLQSGDEVLLSAIDIEHDRLFFASSSNYIYTIKLIFQKPKDFLSSVQQEPILVDLEDDDKIVSFDYLIEREALIIGTCNGQILLSGADCQYELIGAIEGGVKCIAPSPDGGVVAIVSGCSKLLLMTTEWEVICEIPLQDLDVNASAPKECSISWRGDGKYFSILSGKTLKIFERDSGNLSATSEGRNFMDAVLDWQPSGAKIATVYDQKSEGKPPLIQFFERNGLERSSFELDTDTDWRVEILRWNCSSDLLAMLCKCEEFDCLKIWFFSNNHWYLKQEIRFFKKDKVKFMWNAENPLGLICWTQNGWVTTYNFIWATAVTNLSIAMVVDGSRLLITPLALALVPPPLYYLSMKFSSAIHDITFYSGNSRSYLAVLLSNKRLAVKELPQDWEEVEGEEITVHDCCCSFIVLKHFAWLDEHRLLAYSDNNYFLEIELSSCDGCWRAEVSHQIPADGLVISLSSASYPWNNSAVVQFYGGRVCEYSSKLEDCSSAGFLSSCPWMSVGTSNNGCKLIVGLDNQSRLQANGVILCKNCRGFSFYSTAEVHVVSHLIVVTKNDLLFVQTSDALCGEIEESDKTCVNLWERGANVVGVLHGDEAAVVIQTNRGNLECVYPRKLVLNSIVSAMDQHRWRDVMFMIRRHRIDFNFIVDYCGWNRFTGFASDFVKQVENFNWLSEFVSSVKKGNVAEALYRNHLPCSWGEHVEDDKKVSCVLMSIKKVLEEEVPERPARELCILTTLAKSDPPKIEEALIRIRSIREKELLHLPNNNIYPPSDEALKHLLWLCDPEVVYEAALGLYDLNLAAIVALNSQKDPKEFLPLLQGLEQKQRFLMHYEIDLKLKRFGSALRNLASGGDTYFRACLCLMNDHPELFPLGLQLFKDSLMKQEILEAWGDHLMAEKCFEDAASMYSASSSLKKALKAYHACSDWRGVMLMAGLLKYEQSEIIQLAHELCDELQALGNQREAANIALNYFHDIGIAVQLLISAHDWLEALRLGFRGDLVSEVKTACLECCSNLIDEYKEGLEKIGKYSARYLAVRQRRLLLAATVESLRLAEDDDTASETSSISGLSVYTKMTASDSLASTAYSRSSKARYGRKQRNRGRIRPGSPGEELAIVEHLRSMELSVEARNELRSLSTVLVMLAEEEAARKLQRAAEGFQVSQMAAVRLMGATQKSEYVNETEHNLEHYTAEVRMEMENEGAFFWRSKALIPS